MITLYVLIDSHWAHLLTLEQETFARRLEKYYSATSPLLEFYDKISSQPESGSSRNPNQHPHQLAFPVQPAHKLALETVSGSTSDEIWPLLDAVIRNNFPSLKERPESVDARRRQALGDAVVSNELSAAASQN